MARLEASFGPPAIPPKGLPPSPQLNVDHTVARQDCGQPASPPVRYSTAAVIKKSTPLVEVVT